MNFFPLLLSVDNNNVKILFRKYTLIRHSSAPLPLVIFYPLGAAYAFC